MSGHMLQPQQEERSIAGNLPNMQSVAKLHHHDRVSKVPEILKNRFLKFKARGRKRYASTWHVSSLIEKKLDDIRVCPRLPESEEEHEGHLKTILDLLKKEKLYAKFSKCEFWLQEVQFLGHVVNRDSIHVDPSKVESVKNWKTPESSTEIRSFLGLADKQDEAFQILKEKLCNAPVLALPDGPDDFVVYCDASKQGFGCVLMQRGKVIAYASRQLKEHGIIYTTTQTGIVVRWCSRLKSGNINIYGTKSVIYTDHQSLQYIFDQKDLNMRQRRWIELLSDYECEIKYHPGKANVVADALSRKERLKPRRRLRGLENLLSNRDDGEIYFFDRIWIPSIDLYWWPDMKRDIAEYLADVLRVSMISSRTSETLRTFLQQPEIPDITKSAHFLPIREDYKTEKLAKIYTNEILCLLDEIEIDENLRFVEEPIEIVERDVKKLKRRRIPLVKVRWNSRQGAEYTWEREDQFQKKYPHLFSEPIAEYGVSTSIGYGVSSYLINTAYSSHKIDTAYPLPLDTAYRSSGTETKKFDFRTKKFQPSLGTNPIDCLSLVSGAVPTKTATDAKTAIQEMAEYSQKWHNGTSRGRSTETTDGLAAIQAQLNNLGREIKKVNEKVYAAQVGCEQCNGPHYTKDFPQKEEGKTLEEAYYTQSMEDTLSKFTSESVKRHEENSNLIIEFRASTYAAIRNQRASIKTLEIQIGQMSKVLQERGFGSLPSSTETNPRDQVKSISTTIGANSNLIRRIGSNQYVVSTRQNSTLLYKLRQTMVPFSSRLDNHYCDEEGNYGPKFMEAYGASHINNTIP
ncbi:putative reverse transcriptase domain-containing protein [Tanacetum coccineum]